MFSYTYRYDHDSLSVRANSTYKNREGQVVLVKRKYEHPGFVDPDFDISIIELKEPLKLGVGAQPIDLPEQDQHVPEDTDAVVSGWGSTDAWKSETSKYFLDQLRLVHVPVVSLENCKKAYINSTKITNRMICAGWKDGGKDACQVSLPTER